MTWRAIFARPYPWGDRQGGQTAGAAQRDLQATTARAPHFEKGQSRSRPRQGRACHKSSTHRYRRSGIESRSTVAVRAVLFVNVTDRLADRVTILE